MLRIGAIGDAIAAGANTGAKATVATGVRDIVASGIEAIAGTAAAGTVETADIGRTDTMAAVFAANGAAMAVRGGNIATTAVTTEAVGGVIFAGAIFTGAGSMTGIGGTGRLSASGSAIRSICMTTGVMTATG